MKTNIAIAAFAAVLALASATAYPTDASAAVYVNGVLQKSDHQPALAKVKAENSNSDKAQDKAVDQKRASMNYNRNFATSATKCFGALGNGGEPMIRTPKSCL